MTTLRARHDAADADAIVAAIIATSGVRTHAAAALGITYVHLCRRVRALGLVERLDALALAHGWYDGTPAGRALRARAEARGAAVPGEPPPSEPADWIRPSVREALRAGGWTRARLCRGDASAVAAKLTRTIRGVGATLAARIVAHARAAR